MKLLVTGGSGFIGSHVVDKAIAAGHDARVFDTRPSPYGAETILGDVTNFDEVAAAAAGCDAIVHLAAMADVNEVAKATSLPVVGMGGITSGRDAADFLRAGATCVAVGTESFRDPAAGVRVRTELMTFLETTAPDRRVVGHPMLALEPAKSGVFCRDSLNKCAAAHSSL